MGINSGFKGLNHQISHPILTAESNILRAFLLS